MMRDGEGVKRILVECLRKGARRRWTGCYTHQALRGLNRGELLKVEEGCEEIEKDQVEVVEEVYAMG